MINEKLYYRNGYYVLALYRTYYEVLNKLPLSEQRALDLKGIYDLKGYTVVLINENDFDNFITLNNLTNKKHL